MFAEAIECVGNFTRPIKFISRMYNSTTIIPGTASLFFVNDEGYALTCKHVAEVIMQADKINEHFYSFRRERASIPNDKNRKASIRSLEKRYNFNAGITAELKSNFVDCVDIIQEINITCHPTEDLALVHFKGFKKIFYVGHAVFAKDGDAARPGDMLCRLGYPFPEFSDFEYDPVTEQINWNNSGSSNTPRFPIEGMFTRHLGDLQGNISGIELSTPGLKGQSGGPLFSSNGLIYGMQSKTNHLHLGFDMKDEMMTIDGKSERINNQPFLHVGQCVHVNVIKEFLTDQKVKFYIGNSVEDAEEVTP